jgi:hypothetical protein
MLPLCLSIHASWQCRHAGACCRAGWAIPVEAAAFETLHVHFGSSASGRFDLAGPLPEGAAAFLNTTADGTCLFYEGRLCAIHRELGPGALPVACQQFPRKVLHDGRGTFITLSHFCPTAAGLLLDAGSLEVVEAPASLALNGAVEGLDARAVLPPLLRPGLLMDLDGYGEWERQALRVLDSERWSADSALGQIEAATWMLADWSPGGESLRDAVAAAFCAPPTLLTPTGDKVTRYRIAASAVPAGLRAPQPPRAVSPTHVASTSHPSFDHVARAYLASHLFGNWIAYYSAGLRTVVEYLRVCLSVLTIEVARQRKASPDPPREQQVLEAIRQADLLMVHLVDSRSLARSIEHDQQFRARTFPSLRRNRYSLG